jgi:hypothetical protein
MKKISRKEIMSVNAGRKRRPYSPPQYNSEGEVKAPTIPPSRWHGTAGGAEHAQLIQLRKLKGLKYNQADLDAQFSFFLTRADEMARKSDGFRWETLIDLKVRRDDV